MVNISRKWLFIGRRESNLTLDKLPIDQKASSNETNFFQTCSDNTLYYFNVDTPARRIKTQIRELREGRLPQETLILMCLRYGHKSPDSWRPQKPFVDYFDHRQVEQLAEKIVAKTGHEKVIVFFFNGIDYTR